MPSERLHIAIGVIFNKTRDKVLLSKRQGDVPHAGLWEFPGGKLNPGERVVDALHRELSEELGLLVEQAQPLIVIDHDYPEQAVTLDVWVVDQWRGELQGRESQVIEWVALHELQGRDFPVANGPIVSAINLSPLYLITPELMEDGDVFLKRIRGFIKTGIKLIQFRSKHTNQREIRDLLVATTDICHELGCQLLFNGKPDDAVDSGADGVHLTAERLLQLDERPLSSKYWVAASCHNKDELEHACRIGVDFTVLSPVHRTSSHPAAEPLGWRHFAELTRAATVPVYALGGMNLSDMEVVRQHGGQGVAMISGIWQVSHPESAIRKYMSGLMLGQAPKSRVSSS